jgi:hypothetical protein
MDVERSGARLGTRAIGLGAVGVLAGVVALMWAARAQAATVYSGPVLEQEQSGVRFAVGGPADSRKVKRFEFAASWQCADGASRVHGTLARSVRIKDSGRFRGPADVESPDGATRASLAGKLQPRGRARGTLRVTGPDPGAIEDCDTGRLKWRAKRGDRGLPADPPAPQRTADLSVAVSSATDAGAGTATANVVVRNEGPDRATGVRLDMALALADDETGYAAEVVATSLTGVTGDCPSSAFGPTGASASCELDMLPGGELTMLWTMEFPNPPVSATLDAAVTDASIIDPNPSSNAAQTAFTLP